MKLSSLCAAVAALALSAGAALAQEKPAELKIGITTFLSGPASVFGVPGKAAAELLIEQLNAEGGIGGVKVVPTSCRSRACGRCCRRSPAATATSWPRSPRT